MMDQGTAARFLSFPLWIHHVKSPPLRIEQDRHSAGRWVEVGVSLFSLLGLLRLLRCFPPYL
jgi:hypothetical protein